MSKVGRRARPRKENVPSDMKMCDSDNCNSTRISHDACVVDDPIDLATSLFADLLHCLLQAAIVSDIDFQDAKIVRSACLQVVELIGLVDVVHARPDHVALFTQGLDELET